MAGHIRLWKLCGDYACYAQDFGWLVSMFHVKLRIKRYSRQDMPETVDKVWKFYD